MLLKFSILSFRSSTKINQVQRLAWEYHHLLTARCSVGVAWRYN